MKMIHKTSTLILLLSFVTNLAFGQTPLKTYSGPFTTEDGEGTATYTYKEDNTGERIYQGKFTYTGKYQGKLITTVNGSYDNNLKSGTWTYTSKLISGLNSTFTQTLTANYLKGKLNGELKVLSSLSIATNRINIIANTTCKDGYFTGKFFYQSKQTGDYKSPLTINGQFDSLGYCNGKWSMQYKDESTRKIYDSKFEFTYGVLISFWNIDVQTGAISDKDDFSLPIELLKNYNNENGISKAANGQIYTWTDGHSSDERFLKALEILCTNKFHQTPKGFIGDCPQFKTRNYSAQ